MPQIGLDSGLFAFNTLALLDSYPAISEEYVSWGSQMTGLKQIFLMASVFLMPALGLILLVRNFKRRKPTSN